MAEQGPTNVNVTGISGDLMRQIVDAQTKSVSDMGKQMDRIAKSIEALEVKLPKAVAQAIKETASLGGVSSRASKATAGGVQMGGGDGGGGGTSAPIMASMSRGQWRTGQSPDPSMTNEQFYRAGGFSRFASKSTAAAAGFVTPEGEGDPDAYREAMKAQAAQAAKQYGSTSAPPTGFEKFVYQGPFGGGTSSSRATPDEPFWAGQYSAGMSGRFMPRFSNQSYTYQDYANVSGDILTGYGNWMQSRGSQVLGPSAHAAASVLHTAANKYMPYLDMAQQVAEPFIKRRAERTDYGTLAGGNPQTGDIEGPFGFGMRTKSILTNEATRRGMALQAKAAWDARAAGINTTQASEIIGGVIGMGYKPSSALGTFTDPNQKFNKLVATQESLYRRDPNLVNETEKGLLDQAVRFGGTDEIKAFRRSMKELADVSNASALSIEQMQQGAAKYAQYLSTTGASNPAISAINTANLFTGATGMPVENFAKFEENGLVKANAMVSTGLAPWQLGLMSPSQKLANQNKTLNDIMNMIPVGKDTVETNKYTGEKTVTATGKDKQIATASLYTGMTPQEIKERLEHMTEAQVVADVSGGFGLDEEGKAKDLEGGYIKSGDKEAWGKMKKDLSKKGSGFTKEEIQEIEEAGKTGGFLGIGESDSGETEEGRKAQREKFKEIVARHGTDKTDAKKDSEQEKVMFELTDDAKKILKVANDKGKSDANGGGPSIVQNALANNPAGQLLSDLIGG